MRACHSFLFLGLLGGAVWAGVVGPAWIRDYPGASQSQHNQAGDCYLDTTTHDLIVVGRGELASCPGSSDLLVAKYRSNGALAWVNGFGGTQHANTDMAQAVAVDSVGNIYVAGMVANLGANDFDAAWAKYDSSGNELWRRASLWTGDDAAYGIAIGKAGDVYVCGFDNGNVELDGYLVARIDPANGDTIWKRSYILDTNALARPPRDIHPGFFTQYSEWDNCATAVAASPDSGIVVTGFGLHENREREWWTMKFTPSGVRSWAAVYRNPSTVSHDDDAAFDLAVARNGDVYVVGFDFYESGSNVEGYNYAVVRYSATGSRLNYRSVNVAAEDGDDYAFSVALDDSNPQNVYVTGVLAYPAPLNEQISTQKLSSTLTPRWGTAGAVYGDADQDHGYSICYRKDRVYVTGMNVRDPVVLGYTAANATNKQPLWTYRYDSAGDWDFGACVSAADSDHVFVAGEVYRNTVPPRSSIITARFRYGNPDLAVSAILAPRGEYYHYDTAIPRAVIVNHGNVTPNFNAFMYIGLPYGDTVEVRRPLEPGDSVILTFGSWPAHPTGLVPMRCSLETPGDTNVSNDFRSDTVRVLPIDVGCRRIISPVSPVESGTTVLPVARYRNYDSTAHTFPVWFRIEARRWWERTPVLDADGGRGLLFSTGPRFQVYEDSTTITLGALESTEVSFRLWQASPPDTYLMQAFSAMYG
ncbi:hypothetical protein FJY70_03725, partial [candidate division WOR-3 bacterium]|nr:hypothetical protein [candidate division WOR-3 bacterium]